MYKCQCQRSEGNINITSKYDKQPLASTGFGVRGARTKRRKNNLRVTHKYYATVPNTR